MRNIVSFLFLLCHCFHLLPAQIVLSDCAVPYIDPQDGESASGQSSDTLVYTTFFEVDSLLRSYFVDINAFGGQQVDRAQVFAILPDSSRKAIAQIAFGNCADCLEGFAFVYNDSVYVENVREVEEINLWLNSFDLPDFSLTANLQTLSGAGRLSGILPLCAIGLEVQYDVFNNTANTSTEFSTQIGCLEVVTNCQPQLAANLDCQNDRLLLKADINSACIPPRARTFWTNAAGEEIGEDQSVELPLLGNLGSFFWVIEDECCRYAASILVENPPFLEGEEDQLVCAGDAIQLAGSGGSGHFWKQLNTAIVQDSLLVFPSASPENTGTYVLHAFNEEGCENTDTLELIVNVPPTPLLQLPAICIGDTLLLQLNNDSLFNNIIWISPRENILDSPTLSNIQSNDFGTYAVQAIDSANCTVEQFFEVTASPAPEIEIEYFESCDSITAFLFPDTYDYRWGTGDTTHFLTRAAAGSVEVLIETPAACTSVLPIEFIRSDTGSIRLELAQPVCPNDPTGAIEFIPSNPDVPMIFSIDNGASYSIDPTFKELEAGIYEIVVQDGLGCIDSLQAELIAPSPLEVKILSEPLEVRPNTNVSLSSEVIGNIVEYQWLPKAINSASSSTDFVANNNMNIRLIVKDDRGCLASAGIPLTIVLGDVFAPNAFSPNEDGENDFFTFYSDSGSGEFVEKLQIFDRWGNLVFDQRNFDLNQDNLGWNGRFRGDLLPTAVYTYRAVIRFGDGSKQVRKGDVSLLR